jgi:hypothetical protein
MQNKNQIRLTLSFLRAKWGKILKKICEFEQEYAIKSALINIPIKICHEITALAIRYVNPPL